MGISVSFLGPNEPDPFKEAGVVPTVIYGAGMNPTAIPPPVWIWDGSEWSAPIGPSIRLVVRPDTKARRLWRWDVRAHGGNSITIYRSSSMTHHERTPEAAQAAAWKALGEWLGAA